MLWQPVRLYHKPQVCIREAFECGLESQVIKINFGIKKAIFKVSFVKSMSAYNDDIASVNILSKKPPKNTNYGVFASFLSLLPF